MILKIETEKGWVFFDRVQKCHILDPKNEVALQSYDDNFLCDHVVDSKGAVHRTENTDEKQVNYPERGVRLIGFNVENGGGEWILIDRNVYLMSDEGKNIERIN